MERITEEAAALFPDARRLVMASDTMTGPDAAARGGARRSRSARVDLIIGTQIVAKGWHFPHLTLVGVVDADLGLGGRRSARRRADGAVAAPGGGAGGAGGGAGDGVVADVLARASGDGRAGRGRHGGVRGPRGGGAAAGIWPPYGRLAALIVSAPEASVADALAGALGRAAPSGPGMVVLGPAPAPLSVLRGRHRRRLLLKTRREVAVQPVLREWLGRVVVPRGARVEVDVDPVSFL